jgi:hypothetical protein
MQIAEVLERARALARRAEDEGAKQAYLEVLRRDPTHFCALNELNCWSSNIWTHAAPMEWRASIA